MTGSLLVLLSLLAAPAAVRAQDPSPDSTKGTIRTSATSTRSVRADFALLSVGVVDTGLTPAQAGAKAAAHTNRVRASLEKLGIPHDSLTSRSRWGWWQGRVVRALREPRYIYPAPGTVGPTVSVRDTIFIANDAIEIRTHDLKGLGAVIDTLLAAGLTDISQIQFSASTADSARLTALREATAEARAQADVIAKAAGAQLGAIASLSTESNAWASEPPVVVRGGSGYVSAASIEISADEPLHGTQVVGPVVVVTATVNGVWRVAPAR